MCVPQGHTGGREAAIPNVHLHPVCSSECECLTILVVTVGWYRSFSYIMAPNASYTSSGASAEGTVTLLMLEGKPAVLELLYDSIFVCNGLPS